jgi:hypothetical protein
VAGRHVHPVDWDRRRDAMWAWILMVAVALSIFVAVLVLFDY